MIPWARIILAFFLCIGFAVVAIAFIKARDGGATMRSVINALGSRLAAEPNALTTVSRLRVGPGQQLCLIRCKQREYLLHLGPQSALLIDDYALIGGDEVDGSES